MMMEEANTSFQLVELKKVLREKVETYVPNTKTDKTEFNIGVEAALELVTKIEKELLIESKTMEEALATFKFENSDKSAFLLVLDNIFSDNPKVRSDCYRFFKQVQKPPDSVDFLSAEMTSKLTGKEGVYNVWMTSEIRKGNADALKTWNILIRMMGKAIHQVGPGVQVLNSLLQIVEHAFKNQSQDLRRQGYASWRVLMDNFALDPQVLSSSKRIKLITRPLVGAIGNKSEEQIVAKFDTWWYYICLLNEKLSDHVQSVIIPFLTFCYSSAPMNSGSSTHNQLRASGLQSPAKRFSSIRTRCLEATAVLLGGLNSVRVAKLNITNLNTFTEGVLKPGQYVTHHKFFLWCLEEAFRMLDIKDRTEINYFVTIYQSIVQYTEKIGNTPTYQHQDYVNTFRPPVSLFFITLEKILSTNDCSEHGVGVALTILQELKRLPIHMMISPKSWPSDSDRKYPPLTMILQSMLKKDFIQIAYLLKSSNVKDKYLAVFEKFISTAATSKEHGLDILNEALNSIEEETRPLLCSPSKSGSESNTSPRNDGIETDKKVSIANLWKCIAVSFKANIDRYSEVNQSKTCSLNHDLKACKSVLLHPFKMFPDVTVKGVWNKWADLYRQINMLAALVVTYKTLELECYLSEEGNKLYTNLNKTVSITSFQNYCQHLSQQMVSSIPFSTFQSHDSTNKAELSIQEIKPILVLLVALFKKAQSFDSKYKRSYSSGVSSLCLQLTNLLANINNPKIVRPLIKQVMPALVAALSLHSSLGQGFEKQVKDVYEQVLHQVQTRYDGTYDKEFLEEVKPFLKSALSHNNREIRSRAHQMWQTTFGNCTKEEDIPTEIRDSLKNHSGLSFDSSISSSQALDGTIQTEKITNNPILSFESIFDKTKQHTTSLIKSPAKDLTRAVCVKPKTPTSATKWIKPSASTSEQKSRGRKIFLEDESSQDFVKISSPIVKKRPLTDHQKDILTSRRDDIPALYSELSRDDSQTAPLPEQFQSQNLIGTGIRETQIRIDNQTNSLNDALPKEVKIEKEDNSQDELQADCSFSIIAPKTIQKSLDSKGDSDGNKLKSDSPSRNISISPNVKENKSHQDVNTGTDKTESAKDDLSPKTSSTRRKLKLPRKNAHVLNKVSPGKRRKSRRNIEVASSKEIESMTSVTTDKENKHSLISSNATVVNSLTENCSPLSNTKNMGNEIKSRRKSSSNLYSPIVKFTPSSKKKLERQEDQITKIVQLRSEVHVEVTDKEGSVLREIGSKMGRTRQVNSSSKPASISVDEDPSLDSKVVVEKLSPKNEKISSKSPVKVVNEDPLTLVPIEESNDPSPVARKINFENLKANEIPLKAHKTNSENSQEESVNFDLNNESQSASRKRRISNVVGSASKRPRIKTDQQSSEIEIDTTLGSKKVEASNKRSRRIANRKKSKSPDEENVDEQTKSSDTETKPAVEKQASQKMRRNKYGESPLHVAVKRGDIEKVRSLLSEGANANSKDHAGWRPIHESMREGDNALRIIRLLVDHGADINAQSDSGNTALHDAAAYMTHEMIEYLVKSGADPSVKNLDGKCPLDISKMPQYARSNKIQELLGKVQESDGQDMKMDVDGNDSNTNKTSESTNIAKINQNTIESQSCQVEKCNDGLETPASRLVNDSIANDPNHSIPNSKDDSENSIDLFSMPEKGLSKSSNEESKEISEIKTESTEQLTQLNKDKTYMDNTEFASEESPISKSNDHENDHSKNVECRENEQLTASGSPTSSNRESSNILSAKMPSQNSETEDDKTHELNQAIKGAINVRKSNVTNAAVTKRLERRSNMMSPFGPGSRGARLLEMSNKRSKLSSCPITASNGLNNSFSESNSCDSSSEINYNPISDANIGISSKLALMSPRVESRRSLPSQLPSLTKQQEKELLSTPTSLHLDPTKSKPWQKFVPSPSGASPTASILKRTESPLPSENGDISDSGNGSVIKRRRVKFSDPPVSEQVEIPRSQLTGGPGSGGTSIVGPNKATMSPSSTNSNNIKTPQIENSKESVVENSSDTENEKAATNNLESQAYSEIVSNDNTDLEEVIDIPLIVKLSKEPISTLLTHLTSKTFYKTAQKSLEEKGVETVADLCKLNLSQFNSLKGLKPPNNLATIKEAIRKFEKILQKREIINMANNALYSNLDSQNALLLPKEAIQDKNVSKLPTAPFMETSSTPDEEDKALKEIYERPSPSPTEHEQDIATENILKENDEELEFENDTQCNGAESLSLIEKPKTRESNTVTDTNVAEKALKSSFDVSSKQTEMESVGDVFQSADHTQENAAHITDVYDCPTQPIHSGLMPNTVILDSNSETLVTNQENRSTCIGKPESSEIATQTSSDSETKLEDVLKFLETRDVKTLSDVIGKLHGILQEKICKL